MDAMTNETVTEEIQYIVIRLGEEQYGINIGYVDSVCQNATSNPCAEIPAILYWCDQSAWRSGSGNEPSQTLWTGSR